MQNIERIIIRRLITEAAVRGFVPVKFWDGEEYQEVEQEVVCGEATRFSAIKAIDTVDEGTLHFAPEKDRTAWGQRGVLLILGNGEDVISDWHSGDETFSAACEATLDAIEQKTL